VHDTSFLEFVSTLGDLRSSAPVDDALLRGLAQEAADAVSQLPVVDVPSIAALFQEHPLWVPLLATCAGLSQEQLKNTLRFWFGTTSWHKVARTDVIALVERLNSEYDLLAKLRAERERLWSFSDVLVERSTWSRSRAARSIGRGRRLEDAVEIAIRAVGLTPIMRARFAGRENRTAPCDFLISSPTGEPLIVGCAKGFNSTGSKLTDAVREVEEMANVRLPRQFVFAVVDGIGWLGRQADLRRIYDLRVTNRIDGLYTLARLEEFSADVAQAARLRALIP
jgi:hypothetical protein